MIPKSRLDAMTDGVFAFAMTLLVLNLELPDDFNPASSAEVLAALADLDGSFIAYIITFAVLGIRWLTMVRLRDEPETASPVRAWVVLFSLFLVTLMPFSTMLVGRHGDYWPSIWVYSANMLAAGIFSLWIAALVARETGKPASRAEQINILVLIAAALLSAVIALVNAPLAMLAYLLNFLVPFFQRLAKATT